jgi:ferredoxin
MRLSLQFIVAAVVGNANVSSFSLTYRSSGVRHVIIGSVSPSCCHGHYDNQHQKSKISSFRFSSSSNDSQDTVEMTLQTTSGSNTIKIQKGELLRSAMLKRGLSPHNGRARLINYRGLGTCGTCAVEIFSCNDDTGIEPRERNTKEKLRLNFPPHGSADQSPNLRLACQVQVCGDILVKKRTGFWGQDTDGKLSKGYDAELWFGDLEYMLDSKSPEADNS